MIDVLFYTLLKRSEIVPFNRLHVQNFQKVGPISENTVIHGI